MKKNLIVVLFSLVTAACSNQISHQQIHMSEENYQFFSSMRAGILECFNRGYFNPAFTQQALSAEEQLRNTWPYNLNKMHMLFRQAQASVKGKLNKKECRNVEVHSHNLISNVNEIKYRQQEQRLMQHQRDLFQK